MTTPVGRLRDGAQSPDGATLRPSRPACGVAVRPGVRRLSVLLLAYLAVTGRLTTAEATVRGTEVETLIDGIVELLRQEYVLPERVDAIAARLRGGLDSGEYEGSEDALAMTLKITADLRDSSGDLHFGIRPKPRGAPPTAGPETAAETRESDPSPGPAVPVSGLGRVESLPGGIGYIEIRSFPNPDLGGAAVHDAFARLADSAAMILDLRHSQGGHPGMVAYLLSHFFAGEPFLFNRLEWPSSGRVIEFETVADLPSPRFTDRPVFILVSRHTPSAAEGFSYHMKHLGRALIVGERTAGAAHLSQMFELPGYQVAIPTGRPVSPITGGNWEGDGVEPDHEVPADKALETALELAADRARDS